VRVEAVLGVDHEEKAGAGVDAWHDDILPVPVTAEAANADGRASAIA
jgi:hypothetical protein